MSERIIVSLGDIYASTCGICGERAIWGIAYQSGPEGCKEAINRGETYCEKHLPGEPDPAMSKWIEELVGNVKSSHRTEGELLNLKPAIFYTPFGIHGDKIKLGGDEFTVPQLEALINHMKKYKK